MRFVAFPRRVGLVAVPGIRGDVYESTFLLVDGAAVDAGKTVPGWHLTVREFTREEGEWRRRMVVPRFSLAMFLDEMNVEPGYILELSDPRMLQLAGWVSKDGTEFFVQTFIEGKRQAPLHGVIVIEKLLEHARAYEPFGKKKVSRTTTLEVE